MRNGAAMLSRHAVGTPVFAGMIGATSVGMFLIPMLYVVFQSLRERTRRRPARQRQSARSREPASGD